MDIPKKRVSSLSLSSRSKQPSISKRSISVPCSKCIFCQQQGTSKETSPYFPYMINKALFTKYSSSQNYYYTRGLNEFLGNARTSNVIRFKDILHFDEDEEYLKRFYKYSEYDGKIKMLTEYYKFHQDIARMFMLPLTNVVNRYHDRKRRLEYIRVTKMLREQNQGKTPVPENPKPEKVKHIPLTDRVLADLDLTQSDRPAFEKRVATEHTDRTKASSNRHSEGFYNDTRGNKAKLTPANKYVKDVRGGLSARGGDQRVGEKAVTAADQSRDLSISHTIHELNVKLGEIISTSYSQNLNQDALSYFENSEQIANDNTISNLNNFLDYIQVNQQSSKINKIPAIGSSKPSSQELKSGSSSSRVPEIDLKLHTSQKSNPNPKTTSDNTYSKNSKLLAQKQMSKEINLAEDLLRKVSTDQYARNLKRTTDNERPATSAASTKVSGYPTSTASTARSNNIPINSIKIQNFDEALRIRQQTSPPKIDSQRSVSREGPLVQQRPPSSSLSHRAYDAKGLKSSQEPKQREVLTSRRSSQTTINSSETTTKTTTTTTTTKNKSIFNTRDYTGAVTERNAEPSVSVYTSQNLNSSRPNSQRDMRISLDINALSRHMSQPGGFSNPSTSTYTGTGKTTAGKSAQSAQLKIQSGTGTTTNHHEKSKSMKITPNPSAKDGKYNFGQLDFRDLKDSKSSGTSLSSKKGMVRSQLSSRGDYRSSSNMGIIPEQEIINMKYNAADDLQRKALTHRESNTLVHHKHTKSEGKFAQLDSAVLNKKSSLPHSALFRDTEQAVYEERRQAKNVSPSKQIYTYNHNNIVNIFVSPQEEKLSSEPNMTNKGTTATRNSGGLKLEKDLASSATLNLGGSKLASTEVLIKYNNQNQTRKTEMFDRFERDSPSTTILKKEEPRLAKSKSGYGSLSSTPATTSTYAKSSLQNKAKGKIELDLVEKKIKVSEDDDYEILLKFKGKK